MKTINQPLVIAILGKGGVGKSIITTLMAKTISLDHNYKLLLIDADPTHPHLSKMVKLTPEKSIEDLRCDLINSILNKPKSTDIIAEQIDFDVYNAIVESKQFSLFSIGQPEGPGCFCPSNTILRKVIESISKDFDIVLIDCEAGLEIVNRLVIQKVDIILIVTDLSIRGIDTAESIRSSAEKFTNYKKMGIIVNKIKGDISSIIEKLKELNFEVIGLVPEDENIIGFDLKGRPIIDLPMDSKSYLTLKKIVDNLLN
jgi:CO dehydrogenase maturation factor